MAIIVAASVAVGRCVAIGPGPGDSATAPMTREAVTATNVATMGMCLTTPIFYSHPR
jgi:anthranilate/para-aminobenzoate synthase component II